MVEGMGQLFLGLQQHSIFCHLNLDLTKQDAAVFTNKHGRGKAYADEWNSQKTGKDLIT